MLNNCSSVDENVKCNMDWHNDLIEDYLILNAQYESCTNQVNVYRTNIDKVKKDMVRKVTKIECIKNPILILSSILIGVYIK